MPGFHPETLFGGDPVDPADHFKQSADRFFFREVRTQLLITDREQMLFLLIRKIGHIPRFEFINAVMFFGKGGQLSHFLLTLMMGTLRQVIQEIQHLLRVFRHFCGEGFFRVVFKTE